MAQLKNEAQSESGASHGVPASPSTTEHVNVRKGVRDAAIGEKRQEDGADDAGTTGIGEGATVNHLPDAKPR